MRHPTTERHWRRPAAGAPGNPADGPPGRRRRRVGVPSALARAPSRRLAPERLARSMAPGGRGRRRVQTGAAQVGAGRTWLGERPSAGSVGAAPLLACCPVLTSGIGGGSSTSGSSSSPPAARFSPVNSLNQAIK